MKDVWRTRDREKNPLLGWSEPSQKLAAGQNYELNSVYAFYGPSREKLGPSQKLGPYVQP
jgi:hypothetical protein